MEAAHRASPLNRACGSIKVGKLCLRLFVVPIAYTHLALRRHFAGCTIGCPCSGNGTMSRRPNWSSCDTPGKPTNNDPRTRSINRGAVAGSESDVYKFMPWRAPGSAIPADPCGVAGADQHGIKQTAGGEYFSTKHAKIGDKGSKVLAPYFSGANWTAGSVVNASWFIQANHAGGYYFRLCPADQPLTEECFQKVSSKPF